MSYDDAVGYLFDNVERLIAESEAAHPETRPRPVTAEPREQNDGQTQSKNP
jgi:hypothetical protein